MDKAVLDWLREGPVWLKYAVELQLLGEKPDVRPVRHDSSIVKIIDRLKDINVGIPALKTGRVHYTETGKAYWDLFFLADIGLSVAELELDREAEELFRFQTGDGAFIIPPNVQDNYFCMSAILLSSLARMGYRGDPRLERYIRHILNSQNPDGGWHCYYDDFGALSIESCPMDNLNILMLLGQYEKYRYNPVLNGALDSLLGHWERRGEGWRPHGFGVGRRFMSLQYPAVKYGILRVLDVLSLFPHAVSSRAFRGMLDFVHHKAVGGRYFAEITNGAYTELDFAQTTGPSRWLTFLIKRIDKRVEEPD